MKNVILLLGMLSLTACGQYNFEQSSNNSSVQQDPVVELPIIDIEPSPSTPVQVETPEEDTIVLPEVIDEILNEIPEDIIEIVDQVQPEPQDESVNVIPDHKHGKKHGHKCFKDSNRKICVKVKKHSSKE